MGARKMIAVATYKKEQISKSTIGMKDGIVPSSKYGIQACLCPRYFNEKRIKPQEISHQMI